MDTLNSGVLWFLQQRDQSILVQTDTHFSLSLCAFFIPSLSQTRPKSPELCRDVAHMLTFRGRGGLMGSQPLTRNCQATDGYWRQGGLAYPRVVVQSNNVIILETLYTSTDYSYLFVYWIIGGEEEAINLRMGSYRRSWIRDSGGAGRKNKEGRKWCNCISILKVYKNVFKRPSADNTRWLTHAPAGYTSYIVITNLSCSPESMTASYTH